MSSLNKLTIKESYQGLREKKFSSVELTTDCLAQIKKVDKKIHACLTLEKEKALAQAKVADAKIAKGEQTTLTGIPYLVKDNIMTKGIKTTAASKILENYIAPYNATVIEKIEKQGGVLLGKTNLDEFAHGASTENSAFGPTYNPHDLERVPGGSSGGSAAAVASEQCIYSLGTDTGGSIRCPVAYCGVVGLKPTYGRISRYGLIAMTSSTDCPGPLTKTVADSASILKNLAGYDKMDSTSSNERVDDYDELLQKKLKGLKIGVPKEYFVDGMDENVEKAVKAGISRLEKMGMEIVEISLPHTKYAVPTYYIITQAEISSNLARFDGIKYGLSEQQGKDLMDVYLDTRGKGFGAEVKRRIILGTYALSSGYYDQYYLKAQKVRAIIQKEMNEAMKKVDVIVTPTTPDLPFKVGEQINDPLKMYLEDIFLAGISLAGLPAITVPCGKFGDLPIGMQIIGKSFDEKTVLQVAHQVKKNN
ncbi:Asp-tRNA(Asn)/Glu-tRNA(Gln) amidotransferase subunit GatA [Patescibacteria group bacterium]